MHVSRNEQDLATNARINNRICYGRRISMLERKPGASYVVPLAPYVSLSYATDHEIGLSAGTNALEKPPVNL
jgi:hypothetical protein